MRFFLTTVLALFACVPQAGAALITFPLSMEYSGATAPAGPTPWLTAVFDDGDEAGSVMLLLEATNIVGTEKVRDWNFNLDPLGAWRK